MWVFDGEEWTLDDGGLAPAVKQDAKRPRYEESMPELQVIEVEIVPVTPTVIPVPPLSK